jgi:hypothetical protein
LLATTNQNAQYTDLVEELDYLEQLEYDWVLRGLEDCYSRPVTNSNGSLQITTDDISDEKDISLAQCARDDISDLK